MWRSMVHDQGTVWRKGGLKRLVATEATGVPLRIAGPRRTCTTHRCGTHAAGRDQQLGVRLPDERTCHLDAAHNGKSTSQALADLDFHGQIVRTGIPPPHPGHQSRPSERTNSWTNGYGKLRRMIDHLPPLPRRVRHRPPTHPAGPRPLTAGTQIWCEI